MPLTFGLSILVSGAFGTVQSTPPDSSVVRPAAHERVSARAAMANAVMSSGADPEVLAKVNEYFKDIPILITIAGCESRYHQYDLNGDLLRSVTGDLGVMQINSYAHSVQAQQLGYDLSSIEDNMRYARMLYNRSGTAPWLSSVKCWAPQRTAARNNAQTQPLALQSAKNQE